jgi:hypothetical protein
MTTDIQSKEQLEADLAEALEAYDCAAYHTDDETIVVLHRRKLVKLLAQAQESPKEYVTVVIGRGDGRGTGS